MVDVILFFGRLLLLALLYLFLFAAVKTGVGLVGGTKPRAKGLAVRVTKGPREITGVSVPLTGPVLIGRSPDADLVIADDFVSSTHAKIAPTAEGVALEDLHSTNGTLLNGQPVSRPMALAVGDVIELGANRLEVVRQ